MSRAEAIEGDRKRIVRALIDYVHGYDDRKFMNLSSADFVLYCEEYASEEELELLGVRMLQDIKYRERLGWCKAFRRFFKRSPAAPGSFD